ncbi:MAG: hypothetical protein KatS3mg058_1876 [Roseiflexus sp.]|nr:MAG: hypothetical protein KatS3mg058_1876 [Roseiflexus sp.]
MKRMSFVSLGALCGSHGRLNHQGHEAHEGEENEAHVLCVPLCPLWLPPLSHPSNRRMINAELCPPNPIEFDSAARTSAVRAVFGT